MRIRLILATSFLALCAVGLVAQRGGVEAFEIHRDNVAELPKGKEADGIVGDFVLRNDHVEALVSGALPLRRANMSSEYSDVTQGVLYDLDLRGDENDQITLFRPGGLLGAVSYVRIAKDGSDGEAIIETIRTAAKGGGLYERHAYQLKADSEHLVISSTYRNESGEPKTVDPAAIWKGFGNEWNVQGIRVWDSIDPFDKRGYAWGVLPGTDAIDGVTQLPAGAEETYQIAVAAAPSPLAAWGIVAAAQGDAGHVSGTVKDSAGVPAIHGAIHVSIAGTELPAYPDDTGAFAFHLPVGKHTAKFVDIGRPATTEPIDVRNRRTASLNMAVDKAAMVDVRLRDSAGNASPGKVQFIGVDGTPLPDLGTHYRAHGNREQYQTHDGRFTQQLPPGKYLVRATRGPEYNMEEAGITLAAGQTIPLSFTLKRTVDTTGWVSTDFHAHSTPSGDNYCNTNDRIINFAAEHIEFAPTTEHNRIYDWQPHIEKLGLERQIKTVMGMELTGSGQHFNSFPLSRDPYAQDGGSPIWTFDPRINAMALRHWGTPTLLEGGSRHDAGMNPRAAAKTQAWGTLISELPDRWVQANHPTVGFVFQDRNRDGINDGGFIGFEDMIDAAEVWSDQILNLSPIREIPGANPGDPPREIENRTFGWLQMLNQGRHYWCVAVSDSHRIFGNGAGDWRTYVPSSSDEPRDVDPSEVIRNAKAGQMVISNGPFLVVETTDGLPIGSSIRREGGVELKIEVQTANWMEVNRVQVLVNGRQPAAYNYTVADNPAMFHNGVMRFDETVMVDLQRDAHVIVVATGEGLDLKKGWGENPQGAMPPMAYTNPIYVDVDGGGFSANGDMLGHPILTAKMDD